MSNPNWSLHRAGVTVSAGTATAAVDISTLSPGRPGEDVMIYNPGPSWVFALAGYDTSVAAGTSMASAGLAIGQPIPPGSVQPYFVGDASHLSLRVASGTQMVGVFRGEGQ